MSLSPIWPTLLLPHERIGLQQADITTLDTDVIVNAANEMLLGGGGVDGAIHRAGGPKILEECRRIKKKLPDGLLDAGHAVSTTAGLLAARRVIHTVGPRYTSGTFGEPEFLADCYRTSLALAVAEGWRSVAFPAISTGAFRFPPHLAAPIAIDTVRAFLAETDALDGVIFVVRDTPSFVLYQNALRARGLDC
jgi:O-acetyl-ADP-ribose deacetylase